MESACLDMHIYVKPLKTEHCNMHGMQSSRVASTAFWIARLCQLVSFDPAAAMLQCYLCCRMGSQRPGLRGIWGILLWWILPSTLAVGVRSPRSRFWVYSLVGTDYDGYKMLPHFLEHYSGMGVPHENFHFDLLHDPEEPDIGLKVRLRIPSRLFGTPCMLRCPLSIENFVS